MWVTIPCQNIVMIKATQVFISINKDKDRCLKRERERERERERDRQTDRQTDRVRQTNRLDIEPHPLK